jgi:hypothetical protein
MIACVAQPLIYSAFSLLQTTPLGLIGRHLATQLKSASALTLHGGRRYNLHEYIFRDVFMAAAWLKALHASIHF